MLENGVPSGEIGTFRTYFFSLSSIEGQKQRRQPETFVPCMGTMPMKRAWQENGFSCFKENHFDISYTPRSGRPSWFGEDS